MSRNIVFMGALAIAVAALLSTDLAAQSYLDRNASPAEIKRALQGTRSIRRRPAPSPRARAPTRTGPASAAPRTHAGAAAGSSALAAPSLPSSEGDIEAGPASFRIQFALNSADLRREAIPLLDKLGEALTSEELNDWVFVVEGHTDASGGEQYNLDLSQRRAEAVRDYLVSKHGIEPARLPVKGFGESKPYDPDRPSAAINRRVTFSAPESASDTVATSSTAPAGELQDAPTPESATREGTSGMPVAESRSETPAAGSGDGDLVIETGPAPAGDGAKRPTVESPASRASPTAPATQSAQ